MKAVKGVKVEYPGKKAVLVYSGVVIHMLCAPLVSWVVLQVSVVVQIGVFVLGSHSLKETQSETLRDQKAGF